MWTWKKHTDSEQFQASFIFGNKSVINWICKWYPVRYTVLDQLFLWMWVVCNWKSNGGEWHQLRWTPAVITWLFSIAKWWMNARSSGVVLKFHSFQKLVLSFHLPPLQIMSFLLPFLPKFFQVNASTLGYFAKCKCRHQIWVIKKKKKKNGYSQQTGYWASRPAV